MAKIIGSFDDLWTTELETKAKSLGVIDGDLSRVRATVKNALVSADWADRDGQLLFSSETDQDNALKSVSAVMEVAAQRVAAERRVVVKPGAQPTKSQVLLASAGTQASFSSASPVRGTFTPEMAKVGDRCPRCSGSMDPVGLVNDRAALYCPRDRVVLPLSSAASVR